MSLRTKYLISLLAVSITALFALVLVLGRVVIDDKKIYFRDTQLSQLIRMRDSIMDRMELARLKGAAAAELTVRESGGDLGEVWIIDRGGRIVSTSKKENAATAIASALDWTAVKRLAETGAAQGSFEGYDAAGDQALISYVSLPGQDMLLVSKISMGALRRVLAVFGAYSFGNMLVVLALSIGASVWLSSSMTRRFEILSRTMGKIQEGDFSARADVGGSDEVRFVSDRLNSLTARLAGLIEESAEKARTDEELRVAKLVQDNLLPPANVAIEGGSVIGTFWPASEVSGDWWSTFSNAGRTFIIVADATGHGVAAALMTSAATAAAAILRDREGITPSEFLREMNLAIFRTSKGGMQMTMFVAAYDPGARQLRYANASHDFPYLFKDGGDAQAAIPLSEVTGTRLGEASTSTYEEAAIEMKSDQTLLLFTDGVSELVNAKGLRMSELRLLRLAMQTKERSSSFIGFAGNLKLALREFHQAPGLADDVTLVLFRPSATAPY